MEAAVVEFNLKPAKGIAYLENHKLLAHEPQAIAHFLRTTPGLHKTLVGDYLGEFDEFHLAVMHAYVDSMNFAGLKFDQAIREFLKGFRLPGEAQKIDRIMEKFAARFCGDNPGLFKSADTAYVLAYALIMLNTDAHNPVVTAKMSKQDFVRMNASTGTEGEGGESAGAPVEMLEEIYDSIVANEIKLKEEPWSAQKKAGSDAEQPPPVRLLKVLNLAAPRTGTTADTKVESEAIVRRTQKLIKSGGGKQRGVFHTAVHAELARPMLEAIGWPLLAAFSVTMEDSDSKPRVALCMEGFQLAIQLTKQLGMETMRYALLTSLIRFTFLHAPKEMRTKNVEALRTLLTLAEAKPDTLQDTWNAVLECTSRLEHIVSTPALSGTLMSMNNQVSREVLLAALVDLSGKPCEQLFVNSARLPSDQIVEFFTALCGVSGEELRQLPPRVFSLQKLVEISYYNMVRIRMVWARIWAVLSIHFVTAGGHPDQKIAMYAIDSLRQLAIKYLERSELAHFTFQNDILKPFVVILRTSKNGEIRELVVQCIVQMVRSKVGSIKSGWKSVFMVLTTAAADSVDKIVQMAFQSVELVVLEHFEQIVGDCFMDCVNCLIAFASNVTSPARVSLKAIALLRICEDRLAEGRIPGGASKPVNEGEKANDSAVAEFYWFPMLAGLSDLTSDPRLEVRNCAMEVLFDLLRERGHHFSPAFWESVFERVLFPIFDYVRHAGSGGEEPAALDTFLRETAVHCLHLLCDLLCMFYKAVSFVLPTLLGLLLDCTVRPDQGLAAISAGALLRLMDNGGDRFSESDWTAILKAIKAASEATCPSELLALEKANEPEVTKSSDLATVEEGDEPEVAEAAKGKGEGDSVARGTASSDATDASGTSTATGADAGTGAAGGVEGEGGTPPPAAELLKGELEPSSEFRVDAGGAAVEGVTSTAADAAPAAGGDAKPLADPQQQQAGGLFGQRLINSMMDTLLMKNLSFKAKPEQVRPAIPAGSPGQTRGAEGTPAAPPTVAAGAATEEEEGAVVLSAEEWSRKLDGMRTKCYVQLLLLSALDHLQSQHWEHLVPAHKLQLLDLELAMLEFACEYNSDKNLRTRMADGYLERSPPSLLRQEVAATQLYLATLLRAMGDEGAADSLEPAFPSSIPTEVESLVGRQISGLKPSVSLNTGRGAGSQIVAATVDETEAAELRATAQTRFVHFCERTLEAAAALQPKAGEAVEAAVHRSLAMRAPIVAKVLFSLSRMSAPTFNQLVPRLYPFCTRLICSDQMEVRKALGEVFKLRFTHLLPTTAAA
eukprot:TRINITY_DN720_c0_g1_i1.p1 TRINITY_DN720_c0_g1~~TRINITY_DN720_c0_g1_i1.p1  ORF type:complete len:1456 (+),score=376.66 TRINITY_DN720_c0_g1_i1:496-4368(+)